MGSWGTALYSNDTSSDVRDMCNEVYPLVSTQEGTKLILKEYADIVNSDIIDNDYADFWFALADWQWKHGILTDEIKSKVISLLEAHTGIDAWEDKDIKKRLAVMDKLLQQIKSPQPEVKIPKAKLAKPKHKVGDIIIVRTGLKENDPENWIWNIEDCGYSFIYSQEITDKICETITPPYDAHDKYIAIVCVGTEKVLHSQYVNDIFDEYSVYAFYDYISEEKPTLEQLSKCGFLPSLVMYGQDSAGNIDTLEWRYKFMLYSQSFKISSNSCEQYFKKISCTLEKDRFQKLFTMKNYANEVTDEFELFQAFSSFFEEKVRLTLAGINYDNLLDSKIENPPLRTKEEVSKIIRIKNEEDFKKIESTN